jgi:hypothetical protein
MEKYNMLCIKKYINTIYGTSFFLELYKTQRNALRHSKKIVYNEIINLKKKVKALIKFDYSGLTGEVITKENFSYEEDRKAWTSS